MNAFAIQATRTIVNLLLKVEMECSGSFSDNMVEKAGCAIFWIGRAEWI